MDFRGIKFGANPPPPRELDLGCKHNGVGLAKHERGSRRAWLVGTSHLSWVLRSTKCVSGSGLHQTGVLPLASHHCDASGSAGGRSKVERNPAGA